MRQAHLASRSRVVERIVDAGAAHPIVLVIAAAGFGKSVALDGYSASVGNGCARFNVGPEHRTVDRFARGLTDALSPKRLCRCVVVDNLNVVQDEAEVVAFLVGLIDRTKSQLRWIVASRSTLGLPIGRWLAYNDCDLVVDAADLKFTLPEVADAARDLGFVAEEDEAADVLRVTEGWPAMVNVALRFSMRSSDRPKLRAPVRDAARRFFQEEVAPGLTRDERDVLAVAAVLPEIDIRALDLAGFKDALQIVEQFRARTGWIEEISAGLFRCPDLLRDFLRHEIELLGAHEQESIYGRAAHALETDGKVECALDAYVTARSQPDVLRLLESGGFGLLERGRGDAVSRAIDSLKEATRRNSARVLALRGVLQSLAGNPVRAEALLRRSLSRAQGDRELVASATVRLALLLTNQGGDITELLLPVADDALQSATSRAEALSLLAAQRALAGDVTAARDAMGRVDELLIYVDLESARAKVLQRLGVAAMYVGEPERARHALGQAAGLAMELQLFSLASRAYANLSNLMLHRFDDVVWQLWYAEQALFAATKAGDAFDIETATLQLLDAELRYGRTERSAALEDQLASMRTGDQSRMHYLTPSRALRLAWEGRFAEAHRLLVPCWSKLHHEFDRAVCGAQCALFLALDGKRRTSISLTTSLAEFIGDIQTEGPFTVRSIAMAQLCCGIAEALNGRFTHAERVVRQISSGAEDAVVVLMANIAEELVAVTRRRSRRDSEATSSMLQRLAALGYTHVSLLFESVWKVLEARKPDAETDRLTTAESAILRLLGEGLSPKEIATRRGCSIHTVRAHTANSIAKLRCNGRGEAIALGRRLGILD